MPLFVVVKGDDDSSVFTFDSNRHVIGKPPVADIQLLNPHISRTHAEISESDGRYRLRDLQSKNGTAVNGQDVGLDGVLLNEGDRIDLASGSVVLRYHSGTATLTILDVKGRDGDFRVDGGSREVYVNGDRVEPPLSRKEFDVLYLLHANRGAACSKDSIAVAGWPERQPGDVGDGDIEQCIRRIRLRIEPDTSDPKYVITVKGYGYKINDLPGDVSDT